jgi:Transcriptional regulators
LREPRIHESRRRRVLIEEAIVSGEFAPGTVLRQEQLSERFGVSRTPVREALRRVAALGLVQFVPNRGVRVRTLSHEELRRLSRPRRAREPGHGDRAQKMSRESCTSSRRPSGGSRG